MLMPLDEECVVAMVGVGSVETLPKEFMDEYLLQARMLAQAGKAGPIGPLAVLLLLRQFKIEPPKPKPTTQVSDWDTMPIGSRIDFRGQGGVYCGSASRTTVLIRLDGRRAQEEVMANDVKLMEQQIAPGIPNSAFEREQVPAGAKLLERSSGIAGDISKEPMEPTAQERSNKLLDKWGMVEAATPVWCRAGDTWIEGEFIDVTESGAAGKDSSLAVMINNKRVIVDADDVTITNPELESTPA